MGIKLCSSMCGYKIIYKFWKVIYLKVILVYDFGEKIMSAIILRMKCFPKTRFKLAFPNRANWDNANISQIQTEYSPKGGVGVYFYFWSLSRTNF